MQWGEWGGVLSWGPALRALVERCSQGGNRFSGKGQACELSAHRIQPSELRAFILGNNVGFIICKNGGSKTGLSCSESCTSRDHLSALIESQGCSAGGDTQPNVPDKHTYIRTKVNLGDLSACSLKEKRRWEYLERGRCGIRHQTSGDARRCLSWLKRHSYFLP